MDFIKKNDLSKYYIKQLSNWEV